MVCQHLLDFPEDQLEKTTLRLKTAMDHNAADKVLALQKQI